MVYLPEVLQRGRALAVPDANRSSIARAPSAIGAAWGRPDLGERVLQHAISTATVAALLDEGELTFREQLSAAIDVIAAAADLDPHASARAPRRWRRVPALPTRSPPFAPAIYGSSR